MAALRFRGPVLPDGEARDLYVVDGRDHLRAAGRRRDRRGGVDRPGPGRRALPRRARRERRRRRGDPGAAGAHRPRRRRAAAARLRLGGGHLLDPRPRRPAAADPRGAAHRAHQALHPQLRPRGRARSSSPAYVAQEAQRGDGWVKLVGDWIDRDAGDLAPSFPAEAFAEAIAVAHEHGAKVTAHCFGEAVLPGLIDAGIDCIEHGTGLSEDLIDEMVGAGHRAGADGDAAQQLPELRRRGGREVPGVRRAHARPARPPARHDHGGLRGRGRRSTPAPTPGACCRTGGSRARCASSRDYGFSAEDALGAASWRAREWLGLDGRLAEGTTADFVVFDRDPLAGPVGARRAEADRAARPGGRVTGVRQA